MNQFKQKIQTLLSQLPDSEEEMQMFDQLDKLPALLAAVLEKTASIYKPEALGQLDDFDLEYFINGLYQALATQANWVEANKHLLTPEKLEENTHQIIQKQNEQIQRLAKALANAKEKMPEILAQRNSIEAQNDVNARELEKFAVEEARLKKLLAGKDELIQRKQDLEATQKAVAAGNLEALAEEVTDLESKFTEANQKRQTLLDNQQKYAEELQLAIRQTETLNNASHVLKQMRTQLEHHQEQLKKAYADKAENLRVHVNFNQQNPGGAQSVEQKIQQVNQLLKDIDQDIKTSLV